MAMSAPSKIVLKSTTKMSLNDRFSAYRKNAEHANIGVMRQRIQMQNQTRSKNWRLVQQMENRPSVIAALKLKKRSLRQRLGQPPAGNVRARLSLGSVGGGTTRRGMLNFRGRGGGRFQRRGARGRGSGNRRGGATGNISGGRSSSLGLYRGGGSQWSLNNASQLQGRLGLNRSQNQQRRQRKGRDLRGRGAFRQGRGNFRSPQGQARGSAQQRGGRGKRGSGNRNRGGGGGGGGGRRNQQAAPISKQTLDNELDEYMARTKGNLDMELDSYMAQAQFD